MNRNKFSAQNEKEKRYNCTPSLIILHVDRNSCLNNLQWKRIYIIQSFLLNNRMQFPMKNSNLPER